MTIKERQKLIKSASPEMRETMIEFLNKIPYEYPQQENMIPRKTKYCRICGKRLYGLADQEIGACPQCDKLR